jgi:hypothetical protein
MYCVRDVHPAPSVRMVEMTFYAAGNVHDTRSMRADMGGNHFDSPGSPYVQLFLHQLPGALGQRTERIAA